MIFITRVRTAPWRQETISESDIISPTLEIEGGIILEHCITESESITTAFERYEKARPERTAFAQLESRAKGLNLDDN